MIGCPAQAFIGPLAAELRYDLNEIGHWKVTAGQVERPFQTKSREVVNMATKRSSKAVKSSKKAKRTRSGKLLKSVRTLRSLAREDMA